MKEYLVKGIAIVFILIATSSSLVFGQLSEEAVKRTPDLPGEIVVDFGFNLARSEPAEMNFNWWRSKSLTIGFVKPFDIGKKMSFRPGIAISLDKLGTTDPYTLGYVTDDTGNTNLEFVPIPGSVTKSQLALNYLEVPVEIRFNAGGNEGKGGFYIGLGGMVGFMVDGHTKVKYEYQGRKLKEIKYDNYNYDKVRFGASGKIGFRSFGLFYKYYFSNVFNSGLPAGTDGTAYSTVGITISGF